MTFFKFQLEYFCNQAELHATLDHCAEALHDTPIPTPLGESWTGPPLSRQEVESRLQQQCLQSKTWGQMMQEQEDL